MSEKAAMPAHVMRILLAWPTTLDLRFLTRRKAMPAQEPQMACS
jgi:hypothetical protein